MFLDELSLRTYILINIGTSMITPILAIIFYATIKCCCTVRRKRKVKKMGPEEFIRNDQRNGLYLIPIKRKINGDPEPISNYYYQTDSESSSDMTEIPI